MSLVILAPGVRGVTGDISTWSEGTRGVTGDTSTWSEGCHW